MIKHVKYCIEVYRHHLHLMCIASWIATLVITEKFIYLVEYADKVLRSYLLIERNETTLSIVAM